MNGAGKRGDKGIVPWMADCTSEFCQVRGTNISWKEQRWLEWEKDKGPKEFVSTAVRLRSGWARCAHSLTNHPRLNSHTMPGTLEGAVCVFFGGSGMILQASLWLRCYYLFLLCPPLASMITRQWQRENASGMMESQVVCARGTVGLPGNCSLLRFPNVTSQPLTASSVWKLMKYSF